MILFMSIRLSLLLLESLRNVLDPMKLILRLLSRYNSVTITVSRIHVCFRGNCTYPWTGRKHAKVIYRRLSASKISSSWSLYDSRNAMESTFSVSFYGFSHMVIQSIS